MEVVSKYTTFKLLIIKHGTKSKIWIYFFSFRLLLQGFLIEMMHIALNRTITSLRGIYYTVEYCAWLLIFCGKIYCNYYDHYGKKYCLSFRNLSRRDKVVLHSGYCQYAAYHAPCLPLCKSVRMHQIAVRDSIIKKIE